MVSTMSWPQLYSANLAWESEGRVKVSRGYSKRQQISELTEHTQRNADVLCHLSSNPFCLIHSGVAHALNSAGPAPSALLEKGEPLLDILGVGTAQRDTKSNTIFNALCSTLALVRQHRMGCVSDDDHLPLGPGGHRATVEERPSLYVTGFATPRMSC